ncbi:hypothetical protein F5B21DRAFT_459138, partial [Xylaria acuta]
MWLMALLIIRILNMSDPIPHVRGLKSQKLRQLDGGANLPLRRWNPRKESPGEHIPKAAAERVQLIVVTLRS